MPAQAGRYGDETGESLDEPTTFSTLNYGQMSILADAWQDTSPDEREHLAKGLGAKRKTIDRHLQIFRKLEALRSDWEGQGGNPFVDLYGGTSAVPRPPSEWATTYRYGIQPNDENAVPIFNGRLVLEGDYLVLNDLHLPAIDPPWLERAVEVAKHLGITKCLIAGDFFNAGGISRHPQKKTPYPFSKEVKMGRECLSWLADSFEIVMEPGNHDDWFIFHNGGQVEFTDAARMVVDTEAVRKRLRVTNYDRVTILNAGEKWTIPHQANYSKDTLKVGNKLAQKYQSNVIVPHQHISGKGPDEYDRYVIIDSGGMFNPYRFDYVQLKTSTRREMNQGFVTLVDGWAELWTPDPRITPWRLLGMEAPITEAALCARDEAALEAAA